MGRYMMGAPPLKVVVSERTFFGARATSGAVNRRRAWGPCAEEARPKRLAPSREEGSRTYPATGRAGESHDRDRPRRCTVHCEAPQFG
jgi:hypothetical protein